MPPSPGADQEVLDRELEALVNRCLGGLPVRECNVFLRRYWYGESVAEVAEALGCGEGKVKSSLFRSRRALRDYLEKEGIAV